MTVDVPHKPEFKAIIEGKELTQVPDDLFIPPDALEVLLDSFSGPLDLLLYLIRKQNIDILNIPMTSITRQYLQYIDLMEAKRMELAADYLLMAAMLAEIKSRMLLPITTRDDDEEDEDPRMALVRRLQAYEQMKQAAALLDGLPRQERDHFVIQLMPNELETIKVHPEVGLIELAQAMGSLLVKEQHFTKHEIEREILSVRDRMNTILFKLQEHKIVDFTCLHTEAEGRMGLVVSLLAILELARQSLVIITQTQAFAPIHLQAA
jgi:segregation and condensation protein A